MEITISISGLRSIWATLRISVLQYQALPPQTTTGDFDWYEKTTNCDGDNVLQKEPDIFSQSATTGKREVFYSNECQADGEVELGTRITGESLLPPGITSVNTTNKFSRS